MPGAGFIRRYTDDPGLEILSQIEGVVIIDRNPPDQLTGLTTNAVLCVGEFEDGTFEKPIELFSGVDQIQTLGQLGYQYDGVPCQNPSARSRKADLAITPEYWNGNGFIALSQKKFGRLIVVRVDTSVGEVTFTRLPALVGNSLFNWTLTSGWTLTIFKSITDTDTATFTGAVAALASGTGAYPTTFVGGETLTFVIDEGTPFQIGPVTTTFQAADQTQAQVIARMNASAGYTAFVSTSATVITGSGRVQGNLGNVKITATSGGLVPTKTGYSVSSATGTGNVGNLNAVTFNELKSVIEAAVDNTRVDRDSAGNLRISNTTGTEIMALASSTAAAALGIPVQVTDQEPSGAAFLYSGAGTYPTTFAGGETLTIGRDGEVNTTITFAVGDQTQAQVITKINSFFATAIVTGPDSTHLRFAGLEDGGQVRIVAATPLVLTALGLTTTSNQAYLKAASVIPAGTRVRNASAIEWVTMQSVAVQAGKSGPYTVKVRPGLDDGTLAGANGATVTVLPAAVPGGSYSVSNALALTAALTEPQIDSRYQRAFDASLSTTSVSKEVNLSFSARQSNAVRVMGRQNAITASGSGLRGRRFAMRPPLGTTRAVAKSRVQQPGMGTYRDERDIYCFPGVNVRIPQIADRGVAGGAGFTADGLIDMGFDGWLMSACSQLKPEDNPGQVTSTMLPVLSLERGNADVQNLTMQDYISFKAAGICAPRLDEGVCVAQSGVNNVDPAVQPGLAPINRGRFSDFIGDTLALFANAYAKKTMNFENRKQVFSGVDGFLGNLKSETFPQNARIVDYSLDGKNGNPPAQLAAGVYRMIVKVQMLPDMDVIVFDMQVGAGVAIVQLAD